MSLRLPRQTQDLSRQVIKTTPLAELCPHTYLSKQPPTSMATILRGGSTRNSSFTLSSLRITLEGLHLPLVFGHANTFCGETPRYICLYPVPLKSWAGPRTKTHCPATGKERTRTAKEESHFAVQNSEAQKQARDLPRGKERGEGTAKRRASAGLRRRDQTLSFPSFL